MGAKSVLHSRFNRILYPFFGLRILLWLQRFCSRHRVCWWFVLLAAFPAHLAAQLQSHVPPGMILSWFVSNSCEALIGAGLMRYLVGGPIRFTTLRNVGLFCLCVVFIGPFLSSFLDAAFVVSNHWGKDGYWELIRIRLFSNALAALIIVPLIVTWTTNGVQLLRTTSTFVLPGGMRPLSRFIGSQLCCPL